MSDADESTGAALALMSSPLVGRRLLSAAIDAAGSALEAYRVLVEYPASLAALAPELADGEFRERISESLRTMNLEALRRGLERLGGQILERGVAPYPTCLAAVETAPPLLAIRGNPEALGRPGVAIVGTRRASLSGLRTAARLANEAVEAGFVVVSGMALGIDAAAHEGALAASSRAATVGVLGCGLDVIYPRRNRPLFEAVPERGLLVSEFGLGVAPERWRFPVRNRTIAGASLGVVVVEAYRTGGALSTAAAAREIGREVMAVPGSPENPAAAGTFDLIRDGAPPIASVADIAFAISSSSSEETGISGHLGWQGWGLDVGAGLDPMGRQLIELLGDGGSRSVFDLADAARLASGEVLEAIGALLKKGLVEKRGEGQFGLAPVAASKR